jgi:hypothetical protein
MTEIQDIPDRRVYNLVERGAVVTQPEPEDVARLLPSWSGGDKGAPGIVQRIARALLHRQLGPDVVGRVERP